MGKGENVMNRNKVIKIITIFIIVVLMLFLSYFYKQYKFYKNCMEFNITETISILCINVKNSKDVIEDVLNNGYANDTQRETIRLQGPTIYTDIQRIKFYAHEKTQRPYCNYGIITTSLKNSEDGKWVLTGPEIEGLEVTDEIYKIILDTHLEVSGNKDFSRLEGDSWLHWFEEIDNKCKTTEPV